MILLARRAGKSCISLAMLAPLIAGCAGSMGTMHTDSVTVAPVTSFDGSYRNTLRMAGSFGSSQVAAWCQSPGQPVITIEAGSFTYAVPHPNVPGNATPVFRATMAEDGTFSGQIVAGVMTGRIDGTRIIGQIDGSACVYDFAGART